MLLREMPPPGSRSEQERFQKRRNPTALFQMSNNKRARGVEYDRSGAKDNANNVDATYAHLLRAEQQREGGFIRDNNDSVSGAAFSRGKKQNTTASEFTDPGPSLLAIRADLNTARYQEQAPERTFELKAYTANENFRRDDPTAVACALCRAWPARAPPCAAPFALQTQVAAMCRGHVHDEADVEKMLDSACAEGRLRLIAVPMDGKHERAYTTALEFDRAIANASTAASTDVETRQALALLQRCIRARGGVLATASVAARWAPDVVANALVAEHASSVATAKTRSPANPDVWLARLASSGFVTRATDMRGDTWLRLSVPGVGAALSHLASGNADIMRRLARRPRGEATEELMRRWASEKKGAPFPRGSKLSLAFHIRDLYGRGHVTAIDTGNGETLVRCVR